MKRSGLVFLFVCLLGCSPKSPSGAAGLPATPTVDLSPAALLSAPDGRSLFVACAATRQVAVFDTTRRQVSRWFSLPGEGAPSGLALSADGARLFVTCAAPSSQVVVLNTASGQVSKTLSAGHTAVSPVLSRDGQTLFVCNRFNNAISLFDLRQDREVVRIPVAREPVSAALTPDNRYLLVANHLQAGRSDVPYVAATVSVIEVAQRKVIKELRLPNGSFNLRQLSVSPDGKYAAVAHCLGRYQLPVTQIERGWVNTSALSLLDLGTLEVLNTVLLDDVEMGAANPWATGWSADGRWLCVTHAGTHELSVIDFAALLKKLATMPSSPPVPSLKDHYVVSRCAAEVPNDLSFLQSLRRRIPLNSNGPRALAITSTNAFVTGYFSDTLEVVNLGGAKPAAEKLVLSASHELNPLRRGEMFFNDATISFQGWQSCASCHDEDARVDGLNWDLLNDGIGNPKDTKSLVLSHQTPPVMSLGIRSDAGVAVRAGIQNSLATSLPEEVAVAIDEWLKSLRPAPSPYLVNGQMSAAARRGKQLFKSAELRCADCHEPELFTDLRAYNVGTQNPFDKSDKEFDTPTLHELWRTGPYLHDGSAVTLRDVLTVRNPKDEHGKTSHLTPAQIEDLVEYVLSL